MSRRTRALLITALGSAVASIGVGLAWLPAGVIAIGVTVSAVGLLWEYRR